MQLDRGGIDKEEAFTRILARIPERSRGEARALFEGYKLYVLSNFNTDFQAVIERNKFEFFKLFDGIFVSCFCGAVIQRMKDCKIRIDDYLAGRVDKIEDWKKRRSRIPNTTRSI